MAASGSRSPAVKRILQEMKEMQDLMQQQKVAEFAAEPLEDDIFEWHFALRGASGSDFEGGIYHGRILLPADYPFKPPSFIMLTPSGRFETNTKICLSISSHHPEQWQPSWSLRTALMALIAFFPSPSPGALGAVHSSTQERQRLAKESRASKPRAGSAARQQLVDKLHTYLLEVDQDVRAKSGGEAKNGVEAPTAPCPPEAAPMSTRASTGNDGVCEQPAQSEPETGSHGGLVHRRGFSGGECCSAPAAAVEPSRPAGAAGAAQVHVVPVGSRETRRVSRGFTVKACKTWLRILDSGIMALSAVFICLVVSKFVS